MSAIRIKICRCSHIINRLHFKVYQGVTKLKKDSALIHWGETSRCHIATVSVYSYKSVQERKKS